MMKIGQDYEDAFKQICEYREAMAKHFEIDQCFRAYGLWEAYEDGIKSIISFRPNLISTPLRNRIGGNWHLLQKCIDLAGRGEPMPWEEPKRKYDIHFGSAQVGKRVWELAESSKKAAKALQDLGVSFSAVDVSKYINTACQATAWVSFDLSKPRKRSMAEHWDELAENLDRLSKNRPSFWQRFRAWAVSLFDRGTDDD